ncbi:teicoplanin resistance protein VanZ [Burkholderia stagnalis]|uniref:Teicoplanin resistance protein VanZ n=1 Tax=Burkholderia stagnalis TaxID=1503054 RepID=A0A6L3MNX3_9BURK|nr:VanZ family protein [Burkholderia stagnalis]KAB0632058.1 teicoplanin resistance protein VanZ [Burkholderia stagnalis]KVO44590.1 teicoplanin resistance protein VanZ [Burkholderia stagnalis]KVO76513.1 teicoplanin resistance protein VanZ [Burkholderia stagnalis]KVW55723.1 teicoplanin resistance protein VanZ [Burkholderia stagnalis]KVW81934.1 teicoplanin resistance protein VanZ [Burkholderia stagnalis]
MSVSGSHRASTLARQACAAYAVLIVYASLYPFDGWLALGIGPFDYLFAPMQRYVTAFDVVTNVLGYLPFGALAVLALHPRWRGCSATLIAAALGALLSASMEALQTYLPTRIASNLDLAANALGALLGAALVAPATGALLERGVLRRLRFAWFEADSATPLLLAALWPFAILFPSPFLFGIGDWPAALWERADVSMQDALLAWLPAAWQVTDWPQRVDGWLSDSAWEAVLGGLMLFPALAVASLAMRPRAPRVRLLIAFVVATLALKSAATYMQSATGLVVVWATPGARLGIELGFAAALVALYVPGAWRAALAAAALCAGVALVNLLPVNPFFDYTLSGWRQGRYVHFNSIARWLAWIWPYAALIWLGQRVERAWLPAARRR